MITLPRVDEYLDSLTSDRSPALAALRKEAEGACVPIIRRNTEAFLETLLKIRHPASILELGTAVGYSALVMAEVLPDTRITTIEIGEQDHRLALENFARIPHEASIESILGDAGKVMDELASKGETFEFIFQDAAKGQYLPWLPAIRRLMLPGAVLAADNVLLDGTIVESRYALDRRDRTTHSRMRAFLYEITHSRDFVSSVVPVGDGVSVSWYRGMS